MSDFDWDLTYTDPTDMAAWRNKNPIREQFSPEVWDEMIRRLGVIRDDAELLIAHILRYRGFNTRHKEHGKTSDRWQEYSDAYRAPYDTNTGFYSSTKKKMDF